MTPARRNGFTLLELVVALGATLILIQIIATSAADVRALVQSRRQHTAEAIADALTSTARALPKNRVRAQTSGTPRGVLLGSGTWTLGNGLGCTEGDADGRCTLPFPGNERADGLLLVGADMK